MPIPGPRTQFGPVPGYDNPGLESPDRINLWDRPGSVSWPGRTPSMMVVSLRGCRLAAGQIRKFWRQTVNYIPAGGAYSWTENGPIFHKLNPVGITRALRYKTQSVYMGDGIDNTRFSGLHTVIPKRNRGKLVTLGVGQKRGQPTVRNRVSSFGSRVPTLNQPIEADTSNG